MRRVTRRTWISITGATVSAAAFSPLRAQGIELPAASAAGLRRPGGEPYLRDGGPSDTRTRVTRDLILIEGALFTFDELLAAKDWTGAQQRIDSATSEAREKVEPYMRGQGVKPFTPLIAELVRALDRRDLKALSDLRRKLGDKLVEADRAFRKFRVPYHQFALRAAIEALKVGAKGYDAAFDNGVLVQSADYQEGRGVLRAVERALAEIKTDLTRVDAAATARLVAAVAALRPAWPALEPARAPPVATDALLTLVEAVDEAATPFWKALL